MFLLILLFSEPTWSRSPVYGKRLTAGVTETRALLSCPWCLVDVCLQHRLQQPNPAAAATPCSRRWLPSYFYLLFSFFVLFWFGFVYIVWINWHRWKISCMVYFDFKPDHLACRVERTEGNARAVATGGMRRETKQLQAVPSYLQVISLALDQWQPGYFIYLETWIDVFWGMCRRRWETWYYLPLWLFLW